MRNSFTKKDLKNRMVVETRGQHLFLVVDNCLLGYGEWNRLSMFDENLMFKGGLYRELDIMKVYPEIECFSKTDKSLFLPNRPVWERDGIKELTIEELEKQYGCKVKIVGDK